MKYTNYLKKILTSNVYNVVKETPLEYGYNLSHKTQNNIYYKREDLQDIFSFKIRGAYNKISHLTDIEKQQGVVACSAGNHAQGVALSCNKLQIDSTIVMPVITPEIKVNQVKKYGGNVILYGNNYDEAQAKALEIVKQENRVLIHPYNDPYVIAGQGTIGIEIVKQIKDMNIDTIFCCVGGGGLISGVGIYIKSIRPDIKIIGVEAEDSPSMTHSLQQNEIVELDNVGTFADGAAVKKVGDETFRICKDVVDEMILVSNNEIASSINKFYMDTRTIIEPAGALGIAGYQKYIRQNNIKNKNFISIISGANMDFSRLRYISEISDENEVFISVEIPEIPGSFKKLYNYIYPNNVTEFSYRYNNNSKASIYISFHCGGKSQKIINHLIHDGYQVDNLSNNDLAKDHARYLVGGKNTNKNEELVRFHFPEKPGALDRFLNKISNKWNISLFHYRNHGADIGKVLVGIQIPEKEQLEFITFLDRLGYYYIIETNNNVYKQFL